MLPIKLIDFLVDRSQVVRYHNVLSQVKTASTGAPNGQYCRLFCLLYIYIYIYIYILMILRPVVPCTVCTSTLMSVQVF